MSTLKHDSQAGCRMQSNFVWHNMPNEDVWITGHGVLEPRSPPRHVDRLLSGAQEPAIALVIEASSICTSREA